MKQNKKKQTSIPAIKSVILEQPTPGSNPTIHVGSFIEIELQGASAASIDFVKINGRYFVPAPI